MFSREAQFEKEKRGIPDSQWYPSNLYLIIFVEDIVAFLGLKNVEF